jgi:hypothetical protein
MTANYTRSFFAIAFFALIFLSPIFGTLQADDYLLVNLAINGKSLRLAFDTGASTTMLFRSSVERMGLVMTNADPAATVFPGEVRYIGWTEWCDLTLWNHNYRTNFPVIDIPGNLHAQIDGMLGWDTIRNYITRIDGKNLRFEFMETVPNETTNWFKFPLLYDAPVLTAWLPDREANKGNVVIDTGATGDDVALSPIKWIQWVANHLERGRTLDASYMPGAGIVVREICWADELHLGPLTLTNVCIEKSNVAQTGMGGSYYLASLGLEALKHFDLIIDGKHGFVYMQQNGVTTLPDHNRSGAVCTPENTETDDLTAHVLHGTPAYEAGIRDGDILLARGRYRYDQVAK